MSVLPDTYDSLAHERTALAWRRTALAAAVAGLVVGRAALEVVAPVPALSVGACLAAGGVVCWWTSRRHQAGRPRGAMPLTLIALMQVAGGLGAFVLVLV